MKLLNNIFTKIFNNLCSSLIAIKSLKDRILDKIEKCVIAAHFPNIQSIACLLNWRLEIWSTLKSLIYTLWSTENWPHWLIIRKLTNGKKKTLFTDLIWTFI